MLILRRILDLLKEKKCVTVEELRSDALLSDVDVELFLHVLESFGRVYKCGRYYCLHDPSF